MKHELTSRQPLASDEMAAVFIAIEMLTAPGRPPSDVGATPRWRFSGRWFDSARYYG
jgi:hypothetical protein